MNQPLQLHPVKTGDVIPFPAQAEEGLRSPRQLAEEIRAGSEEAFNEFYQRFSNRLYRYLYYLQPRDEALARDTFQEAMLRVIRYIKPMPDEQALWNWLTRVARTAMYDLLRKRKRNADKENRFKEEHPFSLKPETGDADRALHAALEQVIHRLDASDRELIEAFYFARKDQTRIAEERGTTRKAIESRIARLRQRMRGMLEEELVDA